jgi:hypothetical protein
MGQRAGTPGIGRSQAPNHVSEATSLARRNDHDTEAVSRKRGNHRELKIPPSLRCDKGGTQHAEPLEEVAMPDVSAVRAHRSPMGSRVTFH